MMRAFLEAVESVVPEVVEDLYRIAHQMEQDSYLEAIKAERGGGVVSSWDIIGLAGNEEWGAPQGIFDKPVYATVRDGLREWVTKYHLSTDDDLYEQIALEAVTNYVKSRTPEHRARRVKQRKQAEEHMRRGYKREVTEEEINKAGRLRVGRPGDEKIALSDSVYWDNDIGLIHGLDTAPYPFVFAPFSDLPSENARHYEILLENDILKSDLLTNGKEGDEWTMLRQEMAHPWDGIGWNPKNKEWGEFKAQITDMFNKYLGAYGARTEAFMKEQEYERVMKKRKPIHYEWLAMYQVGRMELDEIQQWYIDQSTDGETTVEIEPIRKSLSTTAKLVGITLRP